MCNKKALGWCQNLTKLRSKGSDSTIGLLVKRLLRDFATQRDVDDTSNCICIQCLNEIQEYDVMCVALVQKEERLRMILLATEKFQSQDKLAIPTTETKSQASSQQDMIFVEDVTQATEIKIEVEKSEETVPATVIPTHKTLEKRMKPEFVRIVSRAAILNPTLNKKNTTNIGDGMIFIPKANPTPVIETEECLAYKKALCDELYNGDDWVPKECAVCNNGTRYGRNEYAVNFKLFHHKFLLFIVQMRKLFLEKECYFGKNEYFGKKKSVACKKCGFHRCLTKSSLPFVYLYIKNPIIFLFSIKRHVRTHPNQCKLCHEKFRQPRKLKVIFRQHFPLINYFDRFNS